MDMETPDNQSSPPEGEKNIPEDVNTGMKSASKGKESARSDEQNFRAIEKSMPCVGNGLYIAGVAGVTSPKILKSREITHVLNLARELVDATFPDFVNVRHVGLRDSEEQNLQEVLPELVEYIHSVISSGGRIVVNCVAGVSRSASVCLAYMVRYENLSLREAFDALYKARPVISPNKGFWKALIQWEIDIRGESTILLRPYMCGFVPELPSYDEYTRMRLRFGWINELMVMWSFHFLLFCLQIISIVGG